MRLTDLTPVGENPPLSCEEREELPLPDQNGCEHLLTYWRDGWFIGHERVCECGAVVEVTDC